MPEQVRCPSCEAVLRVPESLLGRAVKCPKCQTTFTAELPPPETYRTEPDPAEERRPRRPAYEEEEPPPEEPPEEDEDRPRRRRRRRRRYGSGNPEADVAGPAISLMVVSGLSIAGALVDLVFRIINLAAGAGAGAAAVNRPGVPASRAAGQAGAYTAGAVAGGCFDVFSVLLAIIIIVGAVKMKRLEAFGLAMTACILAIVPLHCCCLLGIPFGIWGLVVINKPEVKDAFS
jgi:predicted Zn finger-like uncharacterized protein